MKKGIFLLIIYILHNGLYALPSNLSTGLFVDLLIWKLREGSSENWAQIISPEGDTRTTEILNAPFNYNTGLHIGYNANNFIHDNWQSRIGYTWYQATAFQEASVSSGGIYSAYLGNFFANNTNGANFGPNYRNADLQWNFLFNTLDFEIGYQYNANEQIVLLPYAGIKLAFINQKIKTYWSNPNPTSFFGILIPQNFGNAKEALKQDFWGIGPSFGFTSDIILYKNMDTQIGLSSDFATAVTYGHWKFQDQYSNDSNTNISINCSNINGLAPMVKVYIALSLAKPISKSLLTVAIGYEGQIWFDQMQYYNYNMGRLSNLMSLQGGVIELNWTF